MGTRAARQSALATVFAHLEELSATVDQAREPIALTRLQLDGWRRFLTLTRNPGYTEEDFAREFPGEYRAVAEFLYGERLAQRIAEARAQEGDTPYAARR